MLRLMSIESMMPSNHLILCHPLLLLPSSYPSFSESESGSVASDSLLPHGLYSPWNSPGQHAGVGSCSLLQGIFPTHIEPRSCTLQAHSLPGETPGKPISASAVHIRWPKYWSFSFSISPSKEYSGLISFRTAQFCLLAVQGTKKLTFLIQKILTSLI